MHWEHAEAAIERKMNLPVTLQRARQIAKREWKEYRRSCHLRMPRAIKPEEVERLAERAVELELAEGNELDKHFLAFFYRRECDQV